LPSDFFPENAVASVAGLGGVGAGVGAILYTQTTGFVVDHFHSYTPILIVAALLPALALWSYFLWEGDSPFVVYKISQEKPCRIFGSKRQNRSRHRGVLGHRSRDRLTLAQLGARVAIGYHQNQKGAEEVQRGIAASGGKAIASARICGSPKRCGPLVKQATEQLGPIAFLSKRGLSPGAHANSRDDRRAVGRKS